MTDSLVNPWIRSYPLPSSRIIPFEAGKVGEPSETYTRLSYSTQGDPYSHFHLPIGQEVLSKSQKAKFGEASYTEGLKFIVNENYMYQDELAKSDPHYSVYTSVQDTNFKEHSEISAKSYQRLGPIFKKREYQYEIGEHAGTRYNSKQPLGRLTEQANISSSHQLNRFSLAYQEEIPMPWNIDAYYRIYSCSILSDERLMIADVRGLSVVNIHTGRVEQKKTLDTTDIAVLPNNQVAVTLIWDDEIVILSTNDMSIIRTIRDVNKPIGITYHQDELYVVCRAYHKGPCVNIINLQDSLLREIECKELSSCYGAKIAVSKDAQYLYITQYTSLIRYYAHGQVIARYRLKGTPQALTLLDDGSLLVVSERSNYIQTIHHISADLQQGYELELPEWDVPILGIDPVKYRIYVIDQGTRFHKTIKVYCLQKQSSQSDKKLTSGTADEKLAS